MKNRFRGIIVLIGILALVGCESRQFKAEREMWRAQKLAQAIYRNPKGTPPFQLKIVQDAFRQIMKKYENSLFAVQAQFAIGHLYLVKGEYAKARDEYAKLMKDCDRKMGVCAEAMTAIGGSYEAEGNWDEALASYRKVIQVYPVSMKSIELPIYIIRHYKHINDPIGLRSSVDEAVAHYYNLKSGAEAKQSGYIYQGLITRAYMEAGQWQDVLDNLDKSLRDYPKNNPQEVYLTKALIYITKLNDKPKAKEEFQKIIKEYPRSKLAKQAEAALKKL